MSGVNTFFIRHDKLPIIKIWSMSQADSMTFPYIILREKYVEVLQIMVKVSPTWLLQVTPYRHALHNFLVVIVIYD